MRDFILNLNMLDVHYAVLMLFVIQGSPVVVLSAYQYPERLYTYAMNVGVNNMNPTGYSQVCRVCDVEYTHFHLWGLCNVCVDNGDE